MNVIYIAIVVVAGYLLGSLSISILLSKNLLGRDVRRHGSGNAGATNMARVFGMHAGLLTLAGDMLKAAAAMLLGFWLLGDTGMALGGVACLLGHCFPVLHGFKGGKGVSSGAMVALMIDWRVFLCVVGVSDLMFMTRSVAGIYYKGTECYLIAAIVYLFLTYLSSLLLKAITGKMTAPDNTKRHQGNQTVDLGLPSSN